MYEEYRQDSILALNFLSIFIARRILFCLILVYLLNYPAFQIQSMLLISYC